MANQKEGKHHMEEANESSKRESEPFKARENASD